MTEHYPPLLLDRLREQRWLYAIYWDAAVLHDALQGNGLMAAILFSVWGLFCVLFGVAYFNIDGVGGMLGLLCFCLVFPLPFITQGIPDKMMRNIQARKEALMLQNKNDMDAAAYDLLVEWYASSSLSDPFQSHKEQWERDFKSQGFFRRIGYLTAALFNDPISFAET